MKKWLTGFFMCWGMFLAIPCPAKLWDEKARRQMLAVFPLIGLVVGVIWGAVAWVLQWVHCPLPVQAIILAALPWLCTGFMHLDGFMDVCDAVLSRRDLATRQKILKDSHCGSFAVICMVILGLAQFACFSVSSAVAVFALVFVPIAVRACAAIGVSCLRPIGTSQYSKMERGKAALWVPWAALIIALVVPVIFWGPSGFASAIAAAVYWLAALYGFKQLDGMNGDISGFALVLGELAGVAWMMLI